MVTRTQQPDILFISGSPRSRTSVALIDLIEQGAKNAGATSQRFLLSEKRINPCIGCEKCSSTGSCVFAGEAQSERFTDDYLEFKTALDRVDAVAIVAPLYFAGPSAQLKALFDRLQPYWAQRYQLGVPAREKRPTQLFVVGNGGDTHGYGPLATITKSAMAVAGFNLEKVNNFVGFRAPADVPALPNDAEVDRFTHTQLVQLKRANAHQQNFVQRALDAGGAFARFVVKKREANDLAEQLAQVEAELEVLKKVGDAEKSEPRDHATGAVAKAGSAFDHKGELHAEIELEYSNLLSRTPRAIIEERLGESELQPGAPEERLGESEVQPGAPEVQPANAEPPANNQTNEDA